MVCHRWFRQTVSLLEYITQATVGNRTESFGTIRANRKRGACQALRRAANVHDALLNNAI